MRTIPDELRKRRPTKCGLRVKGRSYSRWPVCVEVSTIYNRAAVVVEVIAPTASDAAHLVQDEFALKLDRPFEVTVAGARGGVAAYLFAGYERLIYLQMINSRL
jgi:hypothetical protein